MPATSGNMAAPFHSRRASPPAGRRPAAASASRFAWSPSPFSSWFSSPSVGSGRSTRGLLPKEETFTADRMLTCDSKLKAFSRARVVSFQQLGEQILSECGGVAIPEVTAIGRQMVLGHLLRKHRDELAFFRSVAHQTGL